MTLLPYEVRTTNGELQVWAYSKEHAILTGLELLGGSILSCFIDPDW